MRVAPHNKQLQRTVRRHHGRAASAPFHFALASLSRGQRAAAELRRYALSAWLTSKGRFGVLVITCILSGCAGSNAAPVPRTSASESRVISCTVPDLCPL